MMIAPAPPTVLLYVPCANVGVARPNVGLVRRKDVVAPHRLLATIEMFCASDSSSQLEIRLPQRSDGAVLRPIRSRLK